MNPQPEPVEDDGNRHADPGTVSIEDVLSNLNRKQRRDLARKHKAFKRPRRGVKGIHGGRG